MTETPFFFNRGQTRLFGISHAPEGKEPRSAFLMSHPFAEEKLWSHRVFVSFARELASKGHLVMRFDYTGAGDSSGATQNTSLDTHLADLAAALETLLERFPNVQRVGFVGLRLGATFAALLAEEAATTGKYPCLAEAPLILWEPVLDGDAYFQEVLRSNLSTQLAVYGKVLENREALLEKIRAGGTVNVDGYEVGKALIDSAGRNDLLAPAPRRHRGPTLVVQIVANEKLKAREDLEAFARGYERGTATRIVEQPFWREIKPFYARAVNLQNDTLQWLEQFNV